MGKLRTSILNLQKLLVENPATLAKAEQALEKEIHNINHIGTTADEGWDLLFMQLSSKFKGEGTTLDANKDKTLKDVFDPSMASTIKGIETFRQDLYKACEKFSAIYDVSIGKIKTDLATAEQEAKNLRAIALKKKSKWLASKKYKDKIKGYLDVIDSVDKIIASQKSGAASIMVQDRAWVDKNFPKIQLSMKVSAVKDRASMSTTGKVKTYLADLGKVTTRVRTFRDEYKSMDGQMAIIKKWADEADELEEVEGEEAPPPKQVDSSKAAKLLGIKDVAKLKKALQAKVDGDEKTALKLLTELAKEEQLKDKADAMIKTLAKAGLL
ncbi:hypothetical protein ACG02S_07270 [Roseateles sp. DC23W]|uniref:Uncharacterized protein n=1 Tax=Pelomonas dachongensis TaxID=3299029 RepID=A0ABW7EJP9_9BURK